jgi:hypothetical protein
VEYCTTTVASVPEEPVLKRRSKRPFGKVTPAVGATVGVAAKEAEDTVQPLPLAVREPEPVPALVAQGAVQLALVPPLMPEHVHLNWPCDELTWPAVPAVHRFADGTMEEATLAAVPQTALV